MESQCGSCYSLSTLILSLFFFLVSNTYKQCPWCFQLGYVFTDKDSSCVQCLNRKRPPRPILSTHNNTCVFCRTTAKFNEYETIIQCSSCNAKHLKGVAAECRLCHLPKANIYAKNDAFQCLDCWLSIREELLSYEPIDINAKEPIVQYCPFDKGPAEWIVKNKLIR